MSNPLNITTAAFGGLREVTTSPLWQWDYGQILAISGLDLPQAFEVHFSNSRKSGETITQIGTDSHVVIPDMYLTSGADIYAFVFLHDGTDDGETEYVIKIPVNKRPKPTNATPTPVQQDAITQAIAALNQAVEDAETAITHYPTIIDGYWYVWDVAEGEYVSTGVEAQGEQGIQGEAGATGATGNGIASAVLNADYTLTLTFTNGQTYITPSIRGEQGQGLTPYGATGQILRKRSAENYDAEWVDYGTPTDEQVAPAVSAWLDNHPEATTTVEDGAISWAKLNSAVQVKIAEKANAIMEDTSEAYSHTGLNYTNNIQFIGNQYAFDTARYANRKNVFPNIGDNSFVTNTITVGRRVNFCTLSGTAPSNSSVTTYAKADNDITPGTYKLIFKVHPGNSIITQNSNRRWGITIDGTKYQDSILIHQDATYEYNVTVTNAKPTVNLNIFFGKDDVYDGFVVWYALYKSDVTIIDTGQSVANGETYDYNSGITEQVIDTCQHKSILSVAADLKTYIDNHVPADVLTEQDLIYISPEMYGAKGDGTTDDSVAINACLTAAYSSSVPIPVRGFGNYKTTTTINIVGNFGNIYINKIKYSGNSFAVKVEGNRNNITFGTIDAETAGGGLWITNTTNNSVANRISASYIISNGVCIQLSPTSGYSMVSYAGSYYQLQYLRSLSSNCVRIGSVYDDSTWEFGYLRNSSDYAIKIEYSIQMKIISGDFEACYAGLYIGAGSVHIQGHVRFEEMMDHLEYGVADKGVIAKLYGLSSITGLQDVDYEAIDVSNRIVYDQIAQRKQEVIYVGKVWRYYNYNYYGEGQSHRRGNERFSADLYILGDQKILVPTAFLFTSVTEDIDYGDHDLLPARYIKISADNCTITLSNSYCPVGISEFYIDQSEYTCTIIDMYGNTIFDGQDYGVGKYKLIASATHSGIILQGVSDWNPDEGINWLVLDI